MKKLRLFSVVLAVVLCIGCLTGCVGNLSTVTINEDGSGTIFAKVGFTEEGLEMLQSMGSSDVNASNMESFEHNGVRYYGSVKNHAFANVDELNFILATEIFKDTANGSYVRVEKLAEKGFNMEISVTPSDVRSTQETDLLQFDTPEEKAAMDELLSTMVVVLDLTFPYPVTQTEGIKDGITIDGNRVVFDMIKVSEALGNISTSTKFKFVSTPAGTTTPTTPVTPTTTGSGRITFTDVPQNMWYYPAVDTLANGGLIQGMGNGIFQPEGTLTYAQFCQILAKAKNMQTGTFADYWAYNAIKSCLNAGYVTDIGVISPAVYDVPMPREAAIAAMYRAKEMSLRDVVNPNPSIPDIEECEYYYKNDVIKAYKFGITKGVDANGTFLPKKSLTRAEVCQLFYNLNWSTKEK